MDLLKEIELVGSVMEGDGVWSHKREAWYKIKEELERLQKEIDDHKHS